MVNELRCEAHRALLLCEVDAKLDAVRALWESWKAGGLPLDREWQSVSACVAGHPERPELVRGAKVAKRGFGTREGRAIMMHAIAHIEFNAINLALDAVQRFAGMPESFYDDWLRVAHEEVYHFELVRAHLRHHGAEYGDFSAHGGLWEMCEKTAYDVMVRMALVPRLLEARGLDVTPGIQEKLRQGDDANGATILDVILRDEVGHVAIGNRWYHYLCEARGIDPLDTFMSLLDKHYSKGLFGPFNLEAREAAGFSAKEMRLLFGDAWPPDRK